MDCETLCGAVGVVLMLAVIIGLVFLFIWMGAELGSENIMEKCDKIGEFTIQDYTYRCNLEEV